MTTPLEPMRETSLTGRLAAWRRLLRPHHAIALVLFVVLVALYNNSVPGRFNTVYANRRFFDSDGEFITRQFNQGKTFTHNDHLLYHVLGRVLHDHADVLPFVARNPVSAHKALSVIAGALGVVLLFLFGRRMIGRSFPALAAALWIGGCAGYWFFAATIDTYLPNLCASILALGLALKCLRDQRLSSYAWLGAAMGLAFLLRTDSFLLGSLILVAAAGARTHVLARLGACGAAGALVAVAGYAWLAHVFYGVAPDNLVAWALGHVDRPEAAKDWGVAVNLSWQNARLAVLNQAVYSVILPGLYNVRSPHPFVAMDAVRMGGPVLWLYSVFMIAAVTAAMLVVWRAARRRVLTPAMVLSLAVIWFVSRTAFYVWWDPKDPFLFAVLTLPALWLVLMLAVKACDNSAMSVTPSAPSLAVRMAREAPSLAVCIMALIIWLHNLHAMILPLRAL